MISYLAKHFSVPGRRAPTLHLCEIHEDQRIGEPLCGLVRFLTITYPSGDSDCKTCHDLAAQRGRNTQPRRFDLSDVEGECSDSSDD